MARTINDFLIKEKLAKQEGISRFKTEFISGVGTPEWKNFIVAAGAYAGKQKQETVYPMDGDHCLLCQQPLTLEAKELITSYWIFIRSEAEKVAAEASRQVQQISQFLKVLPSIYFLKEIC